MIKVLRLLILAQLLVLLVGEDASDKKRTRKRVWGEPYGLITKLQTQCEVEGLAVGTALADNYNAMDEDTEWDQRIHSDFFTEVRLGWAVFIYTGGILFNVECCIRQLRRSSNILYNITSISHPIIIISDIPSLTSTYMYVRTAPGFLRCNHNRRMGHSRKDCRIA